MRRKIIGPITKTGIIIMLFLGIGALSLYKGGNKRTNPISNRKEQEP